MWSSWSWRSPSVCTGSTGTRGTFIPPHPDERNIIFLIEGLEFPTPGDLGDLLDAERSPWNPGQFAYGSFPLYLLKIAHSLIPGDVYDVSTVGRGISALADVFVVFLTYLLGARLYGRRQGLLAAALVSLAVIHIQLSHFLTFDIVLGFTTIAALYFMHRVAVGGRLRDSVIAGVIVGLGMSTKVSMAPMYLALAMAHLLYVMPALGAAEGDRNEASRRIGVAFMGLLAAGCASLATFIIVQPYAIIDASRFVTDVTEQSEMVRRIRDYPYTRQYIDTAAYLYHVRQLAAFGLGWPLGVVAWAGLLYASLRGMRFYYGIIYLVVGWLIPMGLLLVSTGIVFIAAASMIAFAALVATLGVRSRESRGTVLLLSWIVPYLLVTGAFQVKFTRYLIPVTPLLVLFGAQMLFSSVGMGSILSSVAPARGRGGDDRSGCGDWTVRARLYGHLSSSSYGYPVVRVAQSKRYRRFRHSHGALGGGYPGPGAV